MEITPQVLNPLFLGFEMVFQRGFTMPPTHYEKITTVVPSGSRSNVYPWLGRTTKFREWLGSRVHEMLEAHGYTIVNKKFEDSIAVNRDDIEDDQHGVYTPMFEQLGWDAKVHPDTLVFGAIKDALANIDAGSPSQNILAYDGKTFFSAAHPVGLAGQTTEVANVNSGGSGPYWILVDAGRPIRPFIFQKRREYTMTRMNALTDEAVYNESVFRFGVDCRVNAGFGLWQLCYASNQDLSNPANFAAAIAAMRKFKTDAGLPFGAWDSGSGKYLCCGPDLEDVARRILNAELIVGVGAGGPQAGVAPGVTSSNIWKGTCDLLVTPYLA